MSTPHFYCWDDAGSPGRNLSGNNQNRLKQILVACLVTGYGNKPSAGWTIGHEHANGFSLLNADGNVVNFVSDLPTQSPYPAMSSSAVHIYAAESLADTSSAIIDGANLCSGPFRKGMPETAGYPRHVLGYVREILASELSSLHWTLVADDSTFTLNCSSQRSLSSRAYSFSLYCGKSNLDSEVSGNFIVLGGYIDQYSFGQSTSNTFSVGYTSPINPVTGLAETVVLGAEPYKSKLNHDPIDKASKTPARLNLQQPRLAVGSDFVGRLRGVVYDDVLRLLFGWETQLKVLGFSGEDFNDRGKLVEFGGHNYAYAHSFLGSSILTDNPAFW